MTDDLRTRIANAAGDFLSDNFHAYLEQDVVLELADVLISELGLRMAVVNASGSTFMVPTWGTTASLDRIAKAVLDKILVMFTENDPVESASAYIADAILAIPGIAIMELPEPDYGPDGEGQFGWSANGADITATPDLDGHWSVWDSDCQLEPHDARDLAAALLAAAECAEKGTK